MGGMQAAMGRGHPGLRPPVVELAGLHDALTLPRHLRPARRRLLPDRVRQVRTPSHGTRGLAHQRPHAHLRGTLRHRQRLQLCPYHLPVPGEWGAWCGGRGEDDSNDAFHRLHHQSRCRCGGCCCCYCRRH